VYARNLQLGADTFFWYLQLAALGDPNSLRWLVAWLLVHILDRVYHIVALKDFSEDNVATVKPRGDGGGDEKLAAVGILAGVGHTEEALLAVLELEVLIRELLAVN
jgi:hypothetical protein